ncbi:DUF4362 domain-containing protein [Psychrobacillus sp. INOP01]|uniref:DUF4362 domain-containing protein n=1 Tax=Psychrobacillus sp. INOP01 TaxID=2829187 RepID=UPI001BAB1263|nr:DUF4362 domain-containing protein [Psychrobacillus sp. INOP01]QUG41955.1 DUF4362 domain-containing protein [Psychrobacillus sp. INOP01]
MKRVYSLLLCIALVGCSQEPKNEISEPSKLFVNKGQSYNIEEVVNDHYDIQNLEGLDRFVKNVENQKEAIINYIQYGIEGQRGVRTLSFDGEQINVSHSVNGDFIEEYNCKKVLVEIEEEIQKYILSECTGNFIGDFELLSIPNKLN